MKIKEMEDIKIFDIRVRSLKEKMKVMQRLTNLGFEVQINNKNDSTVIFWCEPLKIFISRLTLSQNREVIFQEFMDETKKFLKPTVKECLQVDEKELIEYIKNNNVAIHCPTEEDYNRLTEMLEKNGETWSGGDKFSDCNCWNMYKKTTCITFSCFKCFQYSPSKFYIEKELKILTVKELFNKFTIKHKTSVDFIAEYTKNRISIFSNLRQELKQKYPKLFNGNLTILKIAIVANIRI